MKQIQLPKGLVAIIDDDDYARMLKMPLGKGARPLRWCALNSSKARPYVTKRINKKMILMHRLVWEWTNGQIPSGLEIDHINHNTLDNRKQNLRLVNRGQNNANMRLKSTSTTGFKGVYLAKKSGRKPYWAYIWKDGKRYGLGMYATAEEAARAYNEKALELYGDNAYLNRV